MKRLDTPRARFLVYTSAGNKSQVHRWLRGNKEFDLWITCYAERNTSLLNIADYYNERKGGKFPNLHHVMQQWPDIVNQYQAIFVADDDLHLTGSDISELFAIRERYDLSILQPAFSQFGKISHTITRARVFSFLRHTNFVEVTCPLFRMEKLEAFMRVYDPMLVCHGADYWYMQQLVGDARDKAAIVDAIVARNPHDSTKGGREILNLQSDEERHANWNHIKATKNIREINPHINWSTVRNYTSIRFYSASAKTILTKIVLCLNSIFH